MADLVTDGNESDYIDEEEIECCESDVPPYVEYLFDDYFIMNEDHLVELLMKLISSDDHEDKRKLDDIVMKIIDNADNEGFKCLLDCGYKIEVMNAKEETAIHLARQNNFLRDFCLCRSHRELLENSIGTVNRVSSDGLSFLHIACEIGLEDTVKKFLNIETIDVPYLAETDDDGENEEDRYHNGFTPLHFAVKGLRFGVSKLLVEHGANVNATDLWCRTPLHLASQNYFSYEHPAEDLEILQLLIDNQSNVNAKDAFGNTPLHAAFGNFDRTEWVWKDRRGKQMKKLEILLEHGADATQVNNDGDTLLHSIIRDLKPSHGSVCDRSFSEDSLQVEMISKVLISSGNFDVNARNKQGNSALDLAISHLSSDIVAVLLKHKADCSKVEFRDEKTYFEGRYVAPNYDQVSNLTRIIELLSDHGFGVGEKDNAAILKYLVHNFDDCECWYRRLHKSNALRDNVTNLLHYGSPEHVARIFKRLIESDQRKSYGFNDLILDIAVFYLKCLKLGDLFVHRQIEKAIDNYVMVNNYNKSQYSHWDKKLSDGITLMKSTNLKDNLSFYDVMTMPPNRIYKFTNNMEIDWKIFDKFPPYINIVKGHVTRSVVRAYVENSTFDRLKAVFFPLLFDHLCEEIFNYLSNEDILNMYLALMINDTMINETIL